MGGSTLDSEALREILRCMASSLHANSEEVCSLDAAIGDGDLGVTAELMAKAMSEFADSSQETDIGKLLMQCGMAVNRANPSTFGTIMASGFISGGKAVAGKTRVSLGGLAAIGEAAVEGMKSRGKADIGEKTVLDALVPAVKALADEREKGSDLQTAMRAAAHACEEGMKSTVDMVSVHGKARVFRVKSVGIQDGGATVLHYMIDAAAEYIDAM